MSDDIITLELPAERVNLSIKERKLGARMVPFNVVAVHPVYGPLLFRPGAFDPVVPADVRLRMDHQDPPTGLGARYWEQPDGAWMEFQASRTSRADDQLTLAADGVSSGVSVGYSEVAGKPTREKIGGQMVTVYGPGSAQLHELSTTWMPTFETAGVQYILSTKGTEPMDNDAPVAGIDYDRMAQAMGSATATAVTQAVTAVLARESDAATESRIERLLEKHEELLELQRAQVSVPATTDARKPKLHNWVEFTLRRYRGEPMSSTQLKELALDDVVTTEQPGLVPNRLIPDYADLISSARPFLQSTRQIAPPTTGTSMILPIITTRAVAGTQAGNAEKAALTTTATKVGTGTFAYKAVFGGADISIQMIQRADASFFSLLTGDLGEAYALDCEVKAIAALIAGYTASPSGTHAPDSGGAIDPEDPQLGGAWATSILASKRAPDHIWMSAAAVAAFIDAKSPTTNAPLYSNLAAAFTAGGGPGGLISGLIPVYVPALDTAAVDVIVGPSRGFVWAEDPALRLEADVPSLAGRDIALVGGIFPAPRYADAFTTYTIGS